MTKPKAIYFEGDNRGVHERMRLAYLLPFRKLIEKDFEVKIIEGDADFAHEIEAHQAELAIFSSGIETEANVRAPVLSNLLSHPEIPRVGLMINDLYGISRLRGFRHLAACGCEAYFGVYNFAQNGIPELADRSFMIPFWLNEEIFQDYGNEKVIPVGLYGAGFADARIHYPWRTQITRQVLGHFPCFLSARPDGFNKASLVGKAFAEQLNRTKIAFACGSINQSFTRKHLETCGTRTALFCQKIPIVEALGFRDGENCIFVDEGNVREKVAQYLTDEKALDKLSRHGYDFVRSCHGLEARNQLIDWFALRKAGIPGGKRIGQPDIGGPLELIDQSVPGSAVRWDRRNPMDRLIDQAFDLFWSGNYKDALGKFEMITRGLRGHIESRTGEILCRLAQGDASTAKEQIEQMRAFLTRYFGCDRNEEILEALYALCLVLEAEDQTFPRHVIDLPPTAHPLVQIIRQLLNSNTLKMPAAEMKEKPDSFVTLQYRLKVAPEKWWTFLKTVFRANQKSDLFRQLTAHEQTTPPLDSANISKIGDLHTANDAWRLAQNAVKTADPKKAFAAAETAVALDRNFAAAYLFLGQQLATNGAYEEAYLYIKEASRVAEIPEQAIKILQSMETNPELQTETIQAYRSCIEADRYDPTDRPRRILVFTNLLPPQEMGGFGRSVWELCDGLIRRGHEVSILTADVPELAQAPYPGYERVEKHVERSLQLFGNWDNGAAVTSYDSEGIRRIALANVEVILKAVKHFKPDVCMAGNLDFVSGAMLEPILSKKIPIVHRLGNEVPGYPVEMTPKSGLYCIAGCSNWVNKQLQKSGYHAAHFACLPPGSPLHEYFRLVPPRTDRLRICYAGLMMGYKGPHLILEALKLLKKLQIPFTCEFAGDFKNSQYAAQFKHLVRQGDLSGSVRLLGFCNRDQLAAMYARSNVLVMPSIFEEPFGKVQIEAQAAGLAVVRTPVGGFEDILEDEVNGLLFRREDAEDLARQLYVLSNNTELWQRIAARGQADAFRFTTRRSVEALERIFESLLQDLN